MSEHTASYPFPVLGPERMDYAKGCRYGTSGWSIMSGEVRLLHQIEGDSLVSEMIERGDAQFGCVAVLRATMYRKIFRCDEGKQLSARQKFTLDEGYRSNESPKFMPIVTYMGDEKSIKVRGNHGVHEFWLGQEFKLYKGAILARGEWHHTRSGIGHLLRFSPLSSISDGSIKVEPVLLDSGHFRVRVSPDFYDRLKKVKSMGKDKVLHRDSIFTHALSSGLELLRAEKDNNLETYENFQKLKQVLEDKEEPTWLDDDFDPCHAASVYLPHCLDSSSNQEDEDDNG